MSESATILGLMIVLGFILFMFSGIAEYNTNVNCPELSDELFNTQLQKDTPPSNWWEALTQGIWNTAINIPFVGPIIEWIGGVWNYGMAMLTAMSSPCSGISPVWYFGILIPIVIIVLLFIAGAVRNILPRPGGF